MFPGKQEWGLGIRVAAVLVGYLFAEDVSRDVPLLLVVLCLGAAVYIGLGRRL